MRSKYLIGAIAIIVAATVAGLVLFADQRSSGESTRTVDEPSSANQEELPPATTPSPVAASSGDQTLGGSTASELALEDSQPPTTTVPTTPERELPTPEEVGRPQPSIDEVRTVLGAVETRKLVASGVASNEADWWTTTWHQTLASGATVFCLGSPSGAGCWDDEFLPTEVPVAVIAIGGWPPNAQVLVAADILVSTVEVDDVAVAFQQVPLDVPSGRSIVAIPLPNRSVDVVVRYEDDAQDGTLVVPFEAEYENADLSTLDAPERVAIEYRPEPGMVVGDVTSSGG
ncbi:MAG: hypothetical protein AAGG08_14970 [Actinomycetota bacterium]